MIFVELTQEQAKQLAKEIKKAKKVNWFRRLTAVDLSAKKSQSWRLPTC